MARAAFSLVSFWTVFGKTFQVFFTGNLRSEMQFQIKMDKRYHFNWRQISIMSLIRASGINRARRFYLHLLILQIDHRLRNLL